MIDGGRLDRALQSDTFNKLKNDVYNLGLSSANISKIMLAKKIKKLTEQGKLETRNDVPYSIQNVKNFNIIYFVLLVYFWK